MKVSLLQKRSLGIRGTYQNASHHAQALLPLIRDLEQFFNDHESGLPEDIEWVQGHNVHLIRHQGRTFVLRPFHSGRRYNGISLSLRASRSQEILLATALVDEPVRYRLDFFKTIEFLLNSYRKPQTPEGLSEDD